MPVCSPGFLKLHGVRCPEDLMTLPLIELDDPAGTIPWLSWKVWCEAMKLERAGNIRGLAFSHYDQVIQAAVSGQGVALGRFPLVKQLIDERRLAVPLKGRQFATAQQRAYWLIVAPTAGQRPEVKVFTEWLLAQIGAANAGLDSRPVRRTART
jgi:DNA-binding transcriptional LysR family regulator